MPETMMRIKTDNTIILDTRISQILETFQHLIRDGQFMDCVSYLIESHYMEIEAVVQPHCVVTLKVLIPHSLILAVVDSSKQNKMGYMSTTEHKYTDSH